MRVRCSPEGDSLRVEVIDTGIGIPDEAVPRLFDELYQVSTSAAVKATASASASCIASPVS